MTILLTTVEQFTSSYRKHKKDKEIANIAYARFLSEDVRPLLALSGEHEAAV